MKQKIQTLLADMNTGLIDRQHALKAALLTVLASENMVLIGPPGTAKSMVARRVAQHIQTSDGAHPPGDGTNSYFEYLLTKFSTPEEIFGPLSITELKADRFRRNTAGYLPTAQVAFLDEIFKSSSSILNALLTILNERIFHNGNQPQRVPLRSLISASNELPSGQDELSALYDRFLIRCFVGPVPEEHLHLLFNAPGAAHQARVQLTQRDFQTVDAAAQQVGISPEVGEAIRGIWAAHKEAFKEDRREYLSDRRLVKLLKLLRVSAATNQRTEVDLSDAMLLQHCLWNHPDNMAKVREIVITTLQQHSPKVPVQGDEAVYVLAGNGKQLVQQHQPQRQKAPPPGKQLAVQTTSRTAALTTLPSTTSKTKTKGFMGSGTAQDPIRIGTAEDLISLDDPDIAAAGYHFVQTHDIDCAHITSWPAFAFSGHYHGHNKTIRNLPAANACIFATLNNASVTHLRLEKCALAKTVRTSHITHCQTNGSYLVLADTAATTVLSDCQTTGGGLVKGSTTDSKITNCQVTGGALIVGNAEKTQVVGCQVKGSWLIYDNATTTHITGCQVTGRGLVWGDAINTDISRCQVIEGEPLVLGTASNTRISDCAGVMKWEEAEVNRKFMGCIATKLEQGSTVERCLGMGTYKNTYGDVFFGGIAGQCKSSAIRQCGVGPLDVTLRYRKRIVCSVSYATLENNAAIDSVAGTDDPNGLDGKTVAAARFNQRFFEGNLGWDFDNVWQWDNKNNRPAVRFGTHSGSAVTGSAPATATDSALEDLLTRQVQANIWL